MAPKCAAGKPVYRLYLRYSPARRDESGHHRVGAKMEALPSNGRPLPLPGRSWLRSRRRTHRRCRTVRSCCGLGLAKVDASGSRNGRQPSSLRRPLDPHVKSGRARPGPSDMVCSGGLGGVGPGLTGHAEKSLRFAYVGLDGSVGQGQRARGGARDFGSCSKSSARNRNATPP